jgi:sulfatase modifying factor 1
MADGKPSCCARPPADEPAAASAATDITPSQTPIARRWSPLIGGSFRMGSNDARFPDDGERPVREVSLSLFAIACYAVSNLQFAEFVRQTGYTTDAERCGWSFVFEGLPAPTVTSADNDHAAGKKSNVRQRRGQSRTSPMTYML